MDEGRTAYDASYATTSAVDAHDVEGLPRGACGHENTRAAAAFTAAAAAHPVAPRLVDKFKGSSLQQEPVGATASFMAAKHPLVLSCIQH